MKIFFPMFSSKSFTISLLMFSFFFFWLHHTACGILFPNQEWNRHLLYYKSGVFTRPPGKSLMFRFLILWTNFCIWYKVRAQMQCFAWWYPVFLAPFAEEFNYPSLFWFTFSQNIFFHPFTMHVLNTEVSLL